MIIHSTVQPAGEDFALASAILRAHVVGGVLLDRLAADYGMPLLRLRDRLAAYFATCTAALERPEPEAIAPPPPPAPACPVPPPIRMRVRERIVVPAIVSVPCRSKRRAAGVAARLRKEADRAAELKPITAEIGRAAGAMSLSEVARILNSRGVATLRGGQWSGELVRRIEARTAEGDLPCR